MITIVNNYKSFKKMKRASITKRKSTNHTYLQTQTQNSTQTKSKQQLESKLKEA